MGIKKCRLQWLSQKQNTQKSCRKLRQQQVCSHRWWNDTFPRVLRLPDGDGCWQQELLSGMQLRAEYKPESLQPEHSKDEHPTQLWHVFMGAVPTNFQLLPPCLYKEYTCIFPWNWLFCSSYAGNLCMRRNAQNPKEISNCKENPCSLLCWVQGRMSWGISTLWLHPLQKRG